MTLILRFTVLVLGQAAVAAVVAATAWAAGSIVSRIVSGVVPGVGLGGVGAGRRAGRHADAPVPWALTMALGFAAVTQLLLVAGLAGMLRRPVVLAMVIGIHAAALPAWRRLMSGAVRVNARVAGLVAVGALPAFLLTLYPPLGFDQTMYHLPFARAFAASGGVPFLPALRFPMFPPLAEVLNAAVLMLAGDVATQVTGGVALAVCVGLAYTWARELANAEEGEGGSAGGWLAGAVIVGSPIALYLAASGYVEPLLALFGGASLYAADRARVTQDGRSRSGWVVAAGVLAGSAASVKYDGLYFVPAAVLLIARRESWRVMQRELAIYGVAAAVALLPAYGRLVAGTGNPVFPFYPELFGPNPWGEDVIMGPTGATRWLLTPTRLWDITFRRDAIGGMPHYSPAFLLAVPIIAIAAWRHPRFRALLAIAIGYMILAPAHAHHLFPIAVLWSALAGASAAALLRARAHVRPHARFNALLAAAVILACGGEAYALHRLYRLGPPPVTGEGRDRLIARQRPLYEPIAWLNGVVGPVTVYAVNAEMMVYYASGTLLGDHNGPASFARMEARVRETGSVAAALDSIGATHLLVPTATPFWSERAARDPRLARIYDDGRALLYRVDR